jgi:hypothetical protein
MLPCVYLVAPARLVNPTLPAAAQQAAVSKLIGRCRLNQLSSMSCSEQTSDQHRPGPAFCAACCWHAMCMACVLPYLWCRSVPAANHPPPSYASAPLGHMPPAAHNSAKTCCWSGSWCRLFHYQQQLAQATLHHAACCTKLQVVASHLSSFASQMSYSAAVPPTFSTSPSYGSQRGATTHRLVVCSTQTYTIRHGQMHIHCRMFSTCSHSFDVTAMTSDMFVAT